MIMSSFSALLDVFLTILTHIFLLVYLLLLVNITLSSPQKKVSFSKNIS